MPGNLTETGQPHWEKTEVEPRGWLRWRKRWHLFRNRLLANPTFQRNAVRLPLGRGIANRKATALHNITAGFVYSQTLFACVELELFDHLDGVTLDTQTLSQKTGLPPMGLERLLKAATALELIECYEDGSWGLGELGAAMRANPGIAAMVSHHRHLYQDLGDPVGLLQARAPTALSGYWPYARQEDGASDTYSDLMAVSQSLIADHILDAVSFASNQKLLDIAGGTGAFARAALKRHPQLSTTVFDLPSVIATTQAEPGQAEPGGPGITFQGGNMFEDPLPEGFDLITLIRIAHDHDDQDVQGLFSKIHRALAPGGRLVVAEPMAGTPGSEAIGDTYFGLYLWAMGSGRPRTAPELTRMLALAGFKNVKEKRSSMPCLVRVLVAEQNEE